MPSKKSYLVQNIPLSTNPTLAAQWHPAKNGDLVPSQISASSNKLVWWQCEKGHEWQARISNRKKGSGCPHCNPSRLNYLIPGTNDLLTQNPALAAQWHPTKNGDLTPSLICVNSNIKVWWQCEKGHEWQTGVVNRNKGAGCPQCNPLQPNCLLPGKNDLLTVNPALAARWHPTKNGDLSPSQVTANNPKPVWWLCEQGHEWQAGIKNRNKGSCCPHCHPPRITRLILGQNDLLTVNPTLAAQWHPTKNGDLTPSLVSANSLKKYWWQCENGHEWQATARNRNGGTNCPHCRGWNLRPDQVSLASAYPELATQWHPTKNGSRTPYQIAAGSAQKIWWLCENGHEWQAPVYARVQTPACRYCKAQHTSNNLSTGNPEISAQWHPTKNGELTPSQVRATSKQKAWWQCPEGHEWKAMISNRAQGSGCPVCARLKRKKHFI